MILIIDYDMGNIASISNMLKKIGCEDVVISSNYSDIARADKLILPGVGAFDQGVTNLKSRALFEPVKDAVMSDSKPILGICLGMQLLGKGSEEGNLEGLGVIPFSSQRFRLSGEYKIPHMGWNSVSVTQISNPIASGLAEEEQRYYFVHSYHAVLEDDTDELMSCDYGYKFAAAVSRNHIYGVQFHPEKSHKYGMRLLTNFVGL